MNSSRESLCKTNLFKMASKGKKFSRMMIKKICVKGKALRGEVVLERVSGELAETLEV